MLQLLKIFQKAQENQSVKKELQQQVGQLLKDGAPVKEVRIFVCKVIIVSICFFKISY